MLQLSHKRVFSLLWFFLFFCNTLFGFDLHRALLRDITSQNQLLTEHFHIYWSDEYEYTYPWLVKVDGYPLYIDTIKTSCEEVYQSFENQGFDIPQRIEVYVANSGIEASNPYLPTNSISSLGAFTSDEFPEILITADLPQKSLSSNIKTILSHEMMHVVQYQNNIITSEDETNSSIKWFTEGTAVASEYMLNGYMKDGDWYFSELMKEINKGFFSQNIVVDYANGFLFVYLHKKFGYSLSDFINIYKLHNTPQKFLEYISQKQNLSAAQLIQDIYNSFLYQKELYGEEFKTFTIDPINTATIDQIQFGGAYFDGYELNISNSWQLISLAFDTDNFSFFDPVEYLVWGYKEQSWSCDSNIEAFTTSCEKDYNMKIVNKKDGFWLKSDHNSTINLEIFR